MPKVKINMRPYEKLGCQLKALREKKNIRQREMAADIGVTQQCMSRWESGQQRIGTVDFMKYLRYCFNENVVLILSFIRENLL